jgi:hypothetical protein
VEKGVPPKAACVMTDFLPDPKARALLYLDGKRRIENELGSGTDGTVYGVSGPSVVKVHKDRHRFNNELKAYLRLREQNVNSVGMFHIPELRNYDPEQLIIEISTVRPPYLIDFGKSHIDHTPDYDDEAWDMWRERLGQVFGDNAGVASQIFHQMVRKHGIYHLDLNPYNLNFGDSDDT